MSKVDILKTSLSRRKRVILLIVTAIVLLTALAATVFRDNIAALFHSFSISQSEDSFPHNAQSNSLFVGVSDNLLVCTQSQLQIFSQTGTSSVKETANFSSPAVNASGSYAVSYSVGGHELKVTEASKLLHELTLSESETILSATLNEKGWTAVTTKIGGYKGVVTVYNPSFEAVLAIRLSSRYISDAVVTPDCRGVYLISPGQSQGYFENTLLYYTLSSKDEPTKELSLGSNVILSLASNKACWILGDKNLFILDSSGVLTASYDYEGQHLKFASLQGNGFATLLLSQSSSGNIGTLVTVSDNGKQYGKLLIEGQTTGLAVQGRNIALLTSGEIFSTDRNLTSYRKGSNLYGAKNIAIYQDGKIALIGSSTVILYSPSSGEKFKNEPKEETEQTGNTDTSQTDAAKPAPDTSATGQTEGSTTE